MVPPPNTAPQRIAIIRPSALGDVCRTVPALVSLRRHWPYSEVHWVVQDTFAEAISAHPDLTSVIPFPRARFSRICRSPAATREWFAWTRSLRELKFGLVFDLQGLARSGVITWFTRSPRRIGFADAREGAFLAYTNRHEVPDDHHTVDRMLALLNAEGIPTVLSMRLYVPSDSKVMWSARMHSLGITKDNYAVIAPTSRWKGKRWPARHFADAANYMLNQGIDHVVVVGSATERSQCIEFFAAFDDLSRVHDLLGQTTVGELMAVIEHARIVLANDSAALHMAVGLDRPFVALFGPTNIDLVGPYQGKEWVVQPQNVDPTVTHKDTNRACAIMQQITPDEVFAVIAKRLATSPDTPCTNTIRASTQRNP